jgi:hypothetical protein
VRDGSHYPIVQAPSAHASRVGDRLGMSSPMSGSGPWLSDRVEQFWYADVARIAAPPHACPYVPARVSHRRSALRPWGMASCPWRWKAGFGYGELPFAMRASTARGVCRWYAGAPSPQKVGKLDGSFYLKPFGFGQRPASLGSLRRPQKVAPWRSEFCLLRKLAPRS